MILMGLCLSGSAIAEQSRASAAAEADVKKMLGLPADAKMVYLADDGTPTTFDDFSARLTRATVDLKMDSATGITTLQLTEVGGKREIGSVTRLPPLDGKTLDGKPVRSADFADKPTLVNFFFSTCVPCIKEVPVLNAFARKHPEFNYVAVTHDPAGESRDFVKLRKFEWPIVADASAFIAAAQVKGFPTYLLIENGRIVGRGTGLDEEAMKNPAAGLEQLETWVSARLE
jgi:thiol-disulfide isomerase/thioredoxin